MTDHRRTDQDHQDDDQDQADGYVEGLVAELTARADRDAVLDDALADLGLGVLLVLVTAALENGPPPGGDPAASRWSR